MQSIHRFYIQNEGFPVILPKKNTRSYTAPSTLRRAIVSTPFFNRHLGKSFQPNWLAHMDFAGGEKNAQKQARIRTLFQVSSWLMAWRRAWCSSFLGGLLQQLQMATEKKPEWKQGSLSYPFWGDQTWCQNVWSSWGIKHRWIGIFKWTWENL